MIHCYGAFHVKHNNKMYITLEMFPSQNWFRLSLLCFTSKFW
jgi:hypothetical protein